jgi:hypothetical protein
MESRALPPVQQNEDKMRKFVMTVAAALLPGMGAACSRLEPFDIAKIGGAELILVGEVTGYEDLNTPQGTALVTLQVDTVLKGTAEGQIVLVWNSGLAQGPYEPRARGRVLIAAMEGGRLALSEIVPDMRPDLPAIVQPLCGDVWMQSATPELLAEVMAVITP